MVATILRVTRKFKRPGGGGVVGGVATVRIAEVVFVNNLFFSSRRQGSYQMMGRGLIGKNKYRQRI